MPTREEIVKYAHAAYGYLAEGRQVGHTELADLIEKHYSLENPRNAAVVQALREEARLQMSKGDGHWVVLTAKFKFDDAKTAEKMRVLLEDWLANEIFEDDLEEYRSSWAYSMATADTGGSLPDAGKISEFDYWDLKPERCEIERCELE